MPTWLAVQQSQTVILLTLYDSINDMKSSEISASQLSPAIAIFVVDCCQFGPSWIFGLKMKLTTCAGLVDGTTEQSCLFPDLIH